MCGLYRDKRRRRSRMTTLNEGQETHGSRTSSPLSDAPTNLSRQSEEAPPDVPPANRSLIAKLSVNPEKRPTDPGVIEATPKSMDHFRRLLLLEFGASTRSKSGPRTARACGRYRRTWTHICWLCGKSIRGVTGTTPIGSHWMPKTLRSTYGSNGVQQPKL
ncbi:hypothetical protein BCR34DRAFT_168332 [Clohesyomyces aquaticus]|uniref:Uncharacterized protein n=1 Tax=Clohesyomyces aquaticus TaxID=1231657 RepID=A0A1Y1YHN9_9PLEO|nr:hypothetical protein BCR34DRAFT_168332 [Clohesyomyces aquaticus]